MLTSCCPAWVRFIEANYPDLLDIPSTCRSPQIMFGAIAKTYYAKKMNIHPENMTVISVMPCVAKKTEAERPELVSAGESDVDYVLTTRELAQMFKIAGINFTELPEEDFDDVLGASTGAAVIFGATGGVIEAATRTAYEWITGEELEKVDFTQLRGMEGIRSAEVQIGDLTLNIGIAHGLGNARKLLDDIRAGKSNFHAIEIMACPGGCIGGGGQPYHHGDSEIIKKRAEAIYREDAGKKIRSSHKNPQIIALYDEYLGKPYGEKAHKLLHTTYKKRDKI
jgi:NADH-quinone oxidoreductase subunit G/NADP-reducing hydrogenase subunit HndD